MLGLRAAAACKKLRLTGGEPLVRKNVMSLIRGLGRHLDSGALDELTLTTNGSQLAKYAEELAAVGVRRINVSIDTLDPDKFRELTRWGDLDQVMRGIDAAQAGRACTSRSTPWRCAASTTRSSTS